MFCSFFIQLNNNERIKLKTNPFTALYHVTFPNNVFIGQQNLKNSIKSVNGPVFRLFYLHTPTMKKYWVTFTKEFSQKNFFVSEIADNRKNIVKKIFSLLSIYLVLLGEQFFSLSRA